MIGEALKYGTNIYLFYTPSVFTLSFNEKPLDYLVDNQAVKFLYPSVKQSKLTIYDNSKCLFSGNRLRRLPVKLNTALAMAAAIGPIGGSPTPRGM